MRVLLTVLVLLFVVQSVNADGLKSEAETKAMSDKIMQHFVKEEFKTGLGIAKTYWPLPVVEIDSLANTINTQWGIVRNRYGNPTGTEFIRQESIGKSFLRYYYLHKFENHAIYWRFTFFKPNNVWKVNGITYKDELDFLFE